MEVIGKNLIMINISISSMIIVMISIYVITISSIIIVMISTGVRGGP